MRQGSEGGEEGKRKVVLTAWPFAQARRGLAYMSTLKVR